LAKQRKQESRRVYSTELGRLCPQCQRPIADCVCGKDRPGSLGDGIVRIRRESKGRGGKSVSVVEGIPLPPPALKELAAQLKRRCGVGGSVKGDCIEIQGDQRKLLCSELEDRGYKVKLSGG
jgi:translation initiation factor 1